MCTRKYYFSPIKFFFCDVLLLIFFQRKKKKTDYKISVKHVLVGDKLNRFEIHSRCLDKHNYTVKPLQK